MAPKCKLQQIADEMVQRVRDAQFEKAWVQKTLPGGLDLIYSKAEEQRRLALRRIGVQPSDHEIKVCVGVFGVPEETDPHRYTRKADAGTYHVAELVWREYA